MTVCHNDTVCPHQLQSMVSYSVIQLVKIPFQVIRDTDVMSEQREKDTHANPQ